MKRTLLKSSSLKFTSTLVLTAMLGGTAFAGPDSPKDKTEENQIKSERVIVEESTTTDAIVTPNEAADTETTSAEDIAASWSADKDVDVIIDVPEDELKTLKIQDDKIVIESPQAVIISNPDAPIETDAVLEDSAEPE